MKTFTVPAGGGEMTFWTSFNTEADWDHVFVEVHTVGQDNWTTLPDANGHTTQSTGEQLPAETSGGWRTLHPWLDHYQTQVGDDSCIPTGTTGVWNAASGDSAGWQQWRLNLAAYAGQQVEVSISYVSDWASPGPGRLRGRHRPAGRRRARPSRRASTAGRCRVSPRAALRTANDFIRTDRRPGSRRVQSSPRPTRSTWASASRASTVSRRATKSCAVRWTTSCGPSVARQYVRPRGRAARPALSRFEASVLVVHAVHNRVPPPAGDQPAVHRERERTRRRRARGRARPRRAGRPGRPPSRPERPGSRGCPRSPSR